jgi:hypothetical protein
MMLLDAQQRFGTAGEGENPPEKTHHTTTTTRRTTPPPHIFKRKNAVLEERTIETENPPENTYGANLMHGGAEG